jgi:hypothetical protein
MSTVIDDDYKLQFADAGLLTRLNDALMYNVPVLDSGYLFRCVESGKRLVPATQEYLVGVLELQKQRRNNSVQKEPDSTLDERVQNVLRLLFDEKQLNMALNDMKIDAARLPGIAKLITPAYRLLARVGRVSFTTKLTQVVC